MNKKLFVVLMCLGFLMMVVAPVFAQEDSAYDQLEDMNNTGETFDGSDGQRSGMDIDLETVEVPLPEPVPAEAE